MPFRGAIQWSERAYFAAAVIYKRKTFLLSTTGLWHHRNPEGVREQEGSPAVPGRHSPPRLQPDALLLHRQHR
jgi:hypothetical protein